MTNTPNKIGKIKGLGEIYQIALPLDEQIQAFAEEGIQLPYLASPEEIAQIRLEGLSNDFSRTSIAPIALKGEPTVLIKNSPLMNPIMASSAVKAHRAGKYFEVNPGVYESARDLAKTETAEPEDRTAIILSQAGDFQLTPEMDESKFALRKFAKSYFEKFTQGTIPLWNLSADSKSQAVINYLWFYYPRDGSSFSCRRRYLGIHDWAFGCLRVREAHAKNFGYSLTEVKNANLQAVAEVLAQKSLSGLIDILSEPISVALADKLHH